MNPELNNLKTLWTHQKDKAFQDSTMNLKKKLVKKTTS